MDTPQRWPFEDNIPIPLPHKGRPNGAFGIKALGIQWRGMKVNQSFFIPITAWVSLANARIALDQAIGSRHKNHAYRYTIRARRMAEDGEEGWRIWRVK